MRFPGASGAGCSSVIDAELEEDVSMVVIGGAAIALKYASRHLTRDLDTITSLAGTLAAAVKRAQHALQIQDGLADPPLVGSVGVYDAPECFEKRCTRLQLRGSRHLSVYIPERHDLALMKTSRCDERDLAALAAIHDRRPFKLKTLVERYNEMQFTGPPAQLRSRFLLLVARLFGDRQAEGLEMTLGLHL
jgi:hypothetical protein